MIHIIHTQAAVLARQRQALALRALCLVLPPWVGVLLWAWLTPLLQTFGHNGCNFTGVVFTPAEAAPAEAPARLIPARIPCQAAEVETPDHPQSPALASMHPSQLPELPHIETDDIALETDADALLALQPQEEPSPAAQPRQSTAAVSPHTAADSYTPPAYAHCPQPTYPPQLRQRRMQGSVILNIDIAADGFPTAGNITQSSGSPALDRHALNWVLRHWRFTPARRNNTACPARILTTIHFTL